MKSAQESLDGCQLWQEEFKKTIVYLQQVLEGVCQKMKAACIALEEGHHELKEAWQDWVAAHDLYTFQSPSCLNVPECLGLPHLGLASYHAMCLK